MSWLRRAAAGCVAAGGGYTAGLWVNGKITYAPLRSEDWIMNQLQGVPPVSHHEYAVTTPEPLQILGVPGGLSYIGAWRATDDPFRTVTLAYCGPRSCGFPFMVHGGGLAPLVYDALRVAENEPLKGKLEILYRSPAIVDEIIRIDTRKEPGKSSEAEIKTLHGRTLVRALYHS